MFDIGFPRDWSSLKKLIWLKAINGGGGGGGLTTLTGAIVSFIANASKAIKTLVVTIDSQSGFTGATVYQRGENIFPSSLPSNVIAGQISGGKIASAANARVFAIPVPKNTTIHVQKKSGNASGHILALGDTGSIAVNTPVYDQYSFTNNTDKTYNTGEHGWLYVHSTNLSAANDLWTTTEFMVSVGDSRKTYVAPTDGETTSILWQTEAGSITSGTLTIAEDGSVSLASGGSTYNLTSVTPIDTLLGYNNIWADVGDVAVTIPSNIITNSTDALPLVGQGKADMMKLQS